jgi:hypothetical protein
VATRKLGFITTTNNILHEAPSHRPPAFDLPEYDMDLTMLVDYQHLKHSLQHWVQIADDIFIQQADRVYKKALRVYRSLREQARGKVPGAQNYVDSLRSFFKNRRIVRGEQQLSDAEIDEHLEKEMSHHLDGQPGA